MLSFLFQVFREHVLAMSGFHEQKLAPQKSTPHGRLLRIEGVLWFMMKAEADLIILINSRMRSISLREHTYINLRAVGPLVRQVPKPIGPTTNNPTIK